MKKNSLIFLLSIAFSVCHAQQQFIEVNVTDTVLAEPDFFVYKIFYQTKSDVSFEEMQYKNPTLYEKKRKQNEEVKKASFDSIKAILLEAGFKIVPPSIGETYSQYNNDNTIYTMDIYTGSIDTIALLYNKIKNNNSIISTLQLAKAKDETVYQRHLYSKLIESAMAKANMIAAAIHRKVTAVIAVTEPPVEKAESGWTAYPPLSALSSSIISSRWQETLHIRNEIVISDKKIVTAYPITNTLTVKFTIE